MGIEGSKHFPNRNTLEKDTPHTAQVSTYGVDFGIKHHNPSTISTTSGRQGIGTHPDRLNSGNKGVVRVRAPQRETGEKASRIGDVLSPKKGADSIPNFVRDFGDSTAPRSLTPRDLQGIAEKIELIAKQPVDTIDQAVSQHTRLMDALVHPDVKKVMHTLEREMDPVYKEMGIEGGALVLVGSGATGGMLFRDAMGYYKPVTQPHGTLHQDLDIALLHNKSSNPSLAQLRDLDKRLQTVLHDNKFTLCTINRPSNFWSENLDGKEVTSYLKDEKTRGSVFRMMRFERSFFPSYPAHTNQQNLKTLMTSIATAYPVMGERDWQKLTDDIGHELFEVVKPVQPKHFGVEGDYDADPERITAFERIQFGVSLAIGEQTRKILAVTKR